LLSALFAPPVTSGLKQTPSPRSGAAGDFPRLRAAREFLRPRGAGAAQWSFRQRM